MRVGFFASAAAAALVSLGACLTRGGRAPEPAQDSSAVAASDSVTLEVENHNWSDVNIFVLKDGRRTRLTSATAAKTTTFAFHRRTFGRTGSFRLVVVRIGGRDRYVSDLLPLTERTSILLTVESDLRRSSVGIW